jgi:hypothetical protein
MDGTLTPDVMSVRVHLRTLLGVENFTKVVRMCAGRLLAVRDYQNV